MRILKSTMNFVAFSALLLGTMTGDTTSFKIVPCAADNSVATFATFADKSFKLVAKDGSENAMFSPFSFMQILRLIAAGTGEESKLQIRKALECPYRDVPRRSRVAAGQRVIPEDVESRKRLEALYEEREIKDAELTAVSAFFHAENFTTTDSYKRTLKKHYGVTPKSVDFTHPGDASREINRWVQDQTHDHIKDFIKPGDIDGDTSTVFTGAVYIKGSWVNSFSKYDTTKRPFHVNGGLVKNVSTMWTKEYLNYGKLPEINAEFVELPYVTNPQNASLSMFVIVPDSVDGIGELIRNVEKMNIRKLHGGESKLIQLNLPKFEIEATTNLKEVAKSLGITDIFEDGADFSKMTSADYLSVGNIVQKTVVTVDQKGTEAASGSDFGSIMTLSTDESILLNVDRPFISIIADDLGVPYFMAVVADPSSKSSR